MDCDSTDAIVSELEAIKAAISDLDLTVRNTSTTSVLYGHLWPYLLIVSLIYFANLAWHSSFRYSLAYAVGRESVHKDIEPHDCDFLAAPLGEKHCSYHIKIAQTRWARSQQGNSPIISFDEGKTWSTFTPDDGATVPNLPTTKEIYVSWEKKTE